MVHGHALMGSSHTKFVQDSHVARLRLVGGGEAFARGRRPWKLSHLVRHVCNAHERGLSVEYQYAQRSSAIAQLAVLQNA